MGRARVAAVVVAAIGWFVFGAGLGQQAVAVEVRVPEEQKKPAAEPEAPKAAIKELEGGFVAADLTELFNSDGITSEADRSDSDFDQWKQSFAAEELPDAGKFTPKDVKTPFLFPAKDAGKKNNVACKGQKIPIGLKAKQLCLLATATDANHEEKLTLEYADGQAQADLKVTDWCQPAAFGEKTGAVCPSRVAIGVGGENAMGKEKKETHIWAVYLPLAAERELKSITLPNNAKIHVFAITLAK